jgi:chromosome segregation ATPase
LLHVEQEQKKQPGTLRLSDIATRRSAEFVLAPLSGTQPTIGVLSPQDQQQLVYLQREIEQLVRMNDHLNAALERSELMRQEDAMEYEHRIGQLQSALEEMTLLSSTQQDPTHSAHLLGEDSATQLMSMKSDLDDTEEVHYDTLEKSLGTKRSMQEHGNHEMQELISMLSVQLHQQKEETTTLQQEKAALRQAIEELSAEFLRLDDEKAQIVIEKEQLNHDKEALELSLAHFSAQATASQQLHEKELFQQSVENELRLLRGQLELSQSFEEHSKTTILRLERLVQEQQQLIKDMSTRLHHGGEVDQHAVQQIQMQLLSLQEENMKLNLAREQIEVENQRLHNQLELQRKEMTFKLQDTEEQTHNKDSRLHESQIQIESLQQDLNQVQAENGILSQRIQLFKDQEFKMSRDIELLNHRLQMEQSSLSTQVTSYRQSMDASQHSYDDLLGKYHHLDDEHRRVVREKQQQVTDLEESLSVQRNTVQDLSTRNTLLTEKNDELLEQLQQEKAGKKKYKEQIHQLEIQTNQERKSMLQKIQELQSKVDQQTQWLHQNEMQLKQSEETRLHLQDTLTQSIQTQSERYQSLQLLHDQSTRDLEVSQEERRKEQRAYDDSIRGLQRTIDSLKASQVQLERQLASSESEHAQWQQSCVLKSQDQEVQLKATSDRVQDLLREIHDLNLRFQQEERQNTIHRQSLDTIRNKASAFAQVYQLSLASDPQEDIVPYVQEIFTWFSRSFDELQEGLQLLGNQHAEQEDYWKRRIASLEETVLQTSASWRESQQKLEQTDKNYLERASELQSMQLILQKKDFTIQELNLQIDASRRDYQHVLDQQSQVEKQLVEEKQKLKSLENSLKLLKEKEVSAQDEIQQLRQQLSQAESGKSIVEEQLQALQRLHAQLEAQERDNETKSLQQLKELGQERIKTMDAVRQVDQLQRKKDILEQELAERNSYWENRWSDFSSKVSEEEKKLKESQAILERELRQAQERNSETDDKLRQCERELHRTTSDLRLLQQELEGMASKVVLERVQKNFSDLEIEYAEEKAKWRDSVQKLQDTHEQLEVDLLQHQRLVHQLHEVAAAPLQFSNSSTQRDSHSHNRLSSSQMQLVQTNESTDWRQVSTTLVERLQDLVQQEKLLTAFSDIWLESLKAAETVALENEGSFAYLQGLRTLIQHLHPLPPSMLVSNTGERFKELQERCNVQLLQPLLHEYEQIRQNYVETNYISSTQSQDLEKAKAQVQNLDQQLSTLRQQSAQQQDSYREKISRLEQEQQHAHLEQERQHSLHLAEIAQLNQNWELKLQQLDQHFQRQQEAAVRQVQATAESERLVLQQKNDISHTAIVHDMQDLQNQIRIKDNMNRALEESLAEKLEMLRTRSEDIEQWEERYRQQRAQCGSLQTELDNIKRTLSAKEDRQHEMAATNRRLELDIVSIQEKLRTRSEQVRVLAEQVQVLEVEVAEESVAKERLERRLERQMLKDPSSIRRSVGESHTMTVGHAVNPAKSSTLSSSTPATFAAAGTTSAIQNLVQRRKNSGQFSTHKTAVSHSALDVSGGSSKELLVNAGDRLDDDSENRKRDFSMINDPTSKLARLRNKIASSQHGQSRSGGNNTPSRKLVASSAEFENSSISSAPPLRLQDLLHN